MPVTPKVDIAVINSTYKTILQVGSDLFVIQIAYFGDLISFLLRSLGGL